MPTTTTDRREPATELNRFPGERRIHIGLEARDLGRSKAFYRALFGAEPVKERPGYAKFEPEDPSVNLALNETPDARAAAAHGAAHFGVQVKSVEAVAKLRARLAALGAAVTDEAESVCCYALQTKLWTADPDGNRWEVYTVLADAEQREASGEPAAATAAPCCAPGCCAGTAAGVG